MRKIISIVLVLVMIFSMGIMVFAIDEEQYQTASIDYNLTGYYIINIPSEIHVGELTWVYAEDINIPSDSSIVVEISSLDNMGYIYLHSTETSDTVNVRFLSSENVYLFRDSPTIGVFSSGATGTSLSFTPEPVDSEYARAGYYTGTVDFRISYRSGE